MADKIKSIKDMTHWKQGKNSKWLRGADLDPNRDTIVTVASVEYQTDPGEGVEGAVYVFTFAEDGIKPYGTTTSTNLNAIEKVYGSANPNDWKPGQKLALYPAIITAFGETGPAVRIRDVAPKFITTDQITELDAMLTEKGSDRAKFLAWAKVGRIEDIDAKTYSKAKQMLAAKAAS